MEEARTYPIKRKVRLILSNEFDVFNKFNLGDKGLIFLSGIVDNKRMEIEKDGTETIIQSLEIDKAEKLEASESGRI